MKNKLKNKRGGFIQIIITVIIILFIMKYSGITVSDVVEWFQRTFSGVLK